MGSPSRAGGWPDKLSPRLPLWSLRWTARRGPRFILLLKSKSKLARERSAPRKGASLGRRQRGGLAGARIDHRGVHVGFEDPLAEVVEDDDPRCSRSRRKARSPLPSGLDLAPPESKKGSMGRARTSIGRLNTGLCSMRRRAPNAGGGPRTGGRRTSRLRIFESPPGPTVKLATSAV